MSRDEIVDETIKMMLKNQQGLTNIIKMLKKKLISLEMKVYLLEQAAQPQEKKH